MGLSHERRMGDMHLISGNNLLIWVLEAIKEENKGPRGASKYDVNGSTFSYDGRPDAGRLKL